MPPSGALRVGVFLLLKSTVAVDVVQAILQPKTFEDSLCIYVVAVFAGGWIILLTFVFSYWLYFRAPIPNYTYELVCGTAQSGGRDTSTSENQDQAAGGSTHASTSTGRSQQSKERSDLARTSKELSEKLRGKYMARTSKELLEKLSEKYHTPELFAYGEAPTQQASVMDDKVVAQEGVKKNIKISKF